VTAGGRRVLLLLRQSLTRSDSISIPVQRDTLTRHYQAKGWTVVDALAAENTRGWREKRDDLDDAKARAARGEYDVLAAWSIDRFARNVRILETLCHDLARFGVTIDSYNEPWANEPFMRQIAAALAEKFSSDLRRRMTETVTWKVSEGHHQGAAPLGLVRTDDDRLAPGADADAARLAFRLRLEGRGSPSIARELRERFGIVVPAESVVRLLRNPAYAGGVTGPGGLVVWDAHEPIVDRATWEAAQALIDSRRGGRGAQASWLERLVWCGCEKPMYLVTRASRHHSRLYAYPIFRCRRTLGRAGGGGAAPGGGPGAGGRR
jgi:DNA invertase Pin-like site-specific DNA recombinase